jgi:hypothetical protein
MADRRAKPGKRLAVKSSDTSLYRLAIALREILDA